jgi:hypothetical protein
MASTISNLDLLTNGQAGHAFTANAMFDAGSPSMLFGRRANLCTGLNWFYYGGYILVNGVLTLIPNNVSPMVLAASANNYVECSGEGLVTANTTGFTAGSIPLYLVVTNATGVTASPGYTDYRAWVDLPCVVGLKTIALSDVNITLTADQARNEIIEFTGTLTAQRNIVVPLGPQQWTIYNGSTQALQIIGATGTGVIIATTKTAIVYSNGTNVRRATADV